MKRLIFLVFGLFFLSLTSCQDEEEIQSIDNTQTLTKDAPLSVLIRRVAQNPTYYDNVLDGTASFSVVLPVSITVNSQYIHVNDNDDLAYVKTVKNASNTDDDIVYFNFPITLIKPDYSSTVVQSQQQYNDFISSCGSDANFHEISCVGFKFPIQVKLYNTNSQSASTRKLYNNSEMYNYIISLKADEIYSITYPAEMKNPDGTWTVVNNNAELKSFIENNINVCDSSSNQNTLSEVIVQGTWQVTSFMEGTHDETYEFNGYTFVFASNGTTVATKNSVNTNGTWSTYLDDGKTKLEFYYTGGNPLNHMEEDWEVVEFTDTTIRLSHQSGGGGETHLMTLSRI
ncbi:hypothetical protein KIH23_03480 [Flavobacterium sp. CYK-55]|uniref:hypothetical protein n=1 Tax=Flavobacterium sp. CYK-55 TaxID=2835529 RepID=UPI001BCABB69|nr:hypothetical protein [Flavobacterium sp. CYK-55]MBS7786347.1 hypothetical protein [Flavobacterium sp. CYK-55]